MIGNPVNLYGVLVNADTEEVTFHADETFDMFYKCVGYLAYPYLSSSLRPNVENSIHEVDGKLIVFFTKHRKGVMVLVVCYVYLKRHENRTAAELALKKSVQLGDAALQTIVKTSGSTTRR